MAVQFPSNDAAGNTIWVGSSGSGYVSCSSAVPTDTEGNTFVLLATIAGTGSLNQANQCVFAAFNIVGGTKDAVTCYGTNTIYAIGCNIVELHGVNAFDAATCVSNACVTDGNSAGTISSPAINTNFANEIFIGFGTTSLAGDCTFAGPGSGYTQINSGSVFFEYKVVSSMQSGATATVNKGASACEYSLGIYAFYQAPAMTLNPQTVASGYASVGTVGLAAPAPSGGATVTLSSSNPAVATVPASVLVPAGSTSATFTVNTSSVSSTTLVNISATYNSTTSVAALAVVPVNASPQYSIWNSSTVPTVPDDGGSSAVEVGVKFTVDTSGFISGIRFYKSAANTGTHVGNLWTSTGQLLATATFTGETASGWQQVNFASPILLTANTIYVASYHTTTGHTSDDNNYFTNIGVDNSPLHAPASGASGGNGVLTLGAGSAFPNTTNLDSNYWVDVVFLASSSPPPLQSLTLNPTSVTGGASLTGTVTLNIPAPSGGALVALSTDNPAVAMVPPWALVAQGATNASFTVSTSPVATSTPVSISASLAGAIVSAILTVNPPAVTLNPASVIGGSVNSTGTVTLNTAAPAGGLTVSLSSSNTAAATVPASVTVAASATTATFTVTSLAVPSASRVKIFATLNDGTQSATLTVNPVAFAAVTLNLASVIGGSVNSTGTVTLNTAAPAGGLTVGLSSDNTAAATVPASITVAAAATTATFTVTSLAVPSVSTANISATLNGRTQSATLTVSPLAVAAVALNPASVTGGSVNPAGTVTLSGAAPSSGVSVTLSSSNISVATVPASVTVAPGASSATFTVTTSPVAASASPSISATYNGTQSASLTINPPTITSLTLNPAGVTGGSVNSTGTVMLNTAAPAGGLAVSLSSDNTAAATVPASVTVEAAATTATFTVTSLAVPSVSTANISATLNGRTQSATLTVSPLAVAAVALNPASVTGGSVNPAGTVTLSGAAPSSGVSVTLSSSNISVATVPASVTIAPGASSATFTVTTSPVAASASPSISATYNGTQSASLTINPPALPSVSPTIPTYIQQAAGGGNSPVAVQFPSNDAAGNTIWVGSSGSGYVSCSSAVPTDTEGNTFVLLATIGSLDQANQCVFAAFNIVGGTKDAVTCYGTNTIYAIGCNIVELHGVNAFDAATCVSNACVTDGNSAGTISSPAINTNFANEIFIGFGTTSLAGDCTFAGPGSGYTQINSGSVFFEYKVVSSMQSGATATVNKGASACEYSLGIYAFYQAPAMTLNPQTVASGYASVGTVGLAAPAPSGGATVTLSSSNPAVATVPASVLVPAGSTSATFTVNTSSVSSTTLVNISATYNSTTSVAALAVVPVNASPQYSIWNSSTVPTVPDDGGSSAVEVGVKFTVDTSGFISGIRFYKSAANTGTHVGNLWTSTGQLLATATFTGETASGWQQVNFASPILLTANTIYVASYHTTTGHTSDDNNYFTNIGVDNSPLHAPASGASGGNGVLTLGAGSAFPNTTNLDSNYWVDVVFLASSSPPPLQSLTLNPTSVTGGASLTGTVTLNIPAPSGGALVALSTDNPAVAMVPPWALVAQGATNASFTVSTSPVATSTPVSISASLAGAIVSAILTVNPPAVSSVSVNSTSVIGGTSSTGTVTLSGAAPSGGAAMTLSSSNISAATVPASVTVAAGATSATFIVTTSPVLASTSPSISATYNGTQTASLYVNVAQGQLNANVTNSSFGHVILGLNSVLGVTLTNSSASYVTISNVSISGLGFDTGGVPAGLVLQPGESLPLKVTFAPTGIGSVSGSLTVTSDASNSPAIIPLSGSGVEPPALALTWNASTFPVVGYQVYRGTQSGGPYARSTFALVTDTQYTDTRVEAGQTYFYVVSAIDSDGVESLLSNEVSITVATP